MYIPQAVVDAIVSKFPTEPLLAEKILRELKHDALNDCFYFYYAGMYHGIENDGYIHT